MGEARSMSVVAMIFASLLAANVGAADIKSRRSRSVMALATAKR
jgi:hypothetical protein